MADEEQLAVLRQGVDAWNAWREQNLQAQVDLSEADLVGSNLAGANLGVARLADNFMTPGNFLRAGPDLTKANLSEANLAEANLHGARLMAANLQAAALPRVNLIQAHLDEAILQKANLTEAKLFSASFFRAYLSKADFTGANLTRAKFFMASLGEASLAGANLTEAWFVGAYLTGTDLGGANLTRAVLQNAHLARADLTSASLSEADLTGAHLVETDFTDADLRGCRVYGVSAWDLKLDRAKQENLIITPHGEPEITVDNLEVAQFIYLLLHNEKIREVIDTITTKAVLILGRFTPERKAVLDALREELCKRDRTPIVFDFDQPESKSITDTVKLLAQLARYIIVDLSDPNSAPYELGVISMLGLDSTPVVPLIASGQPPFPMLDDVLGKPWSTQLVRYQDLDDIRANLDHMLIKIAEAKVQELRGPSRLTG